ncbi:MULTISPECIES: hypothetical protein [unclassified Pseudomonas]|uniref:hypothetical protein n=1 Tax=unclassified Pseudomonas TaxID=196821 RepID=UPI0039B75A49
MNISKVILIGLMVIAGCVDAASSMNADMPNGSIKLSANEDGGGKSCVLKIKETTEAQYFSLADTGCTNDEARYFALDNVPSATLIRFDDIRCNQTDHNWYFKIKTIVHPTSTRRINLRELQGAATGSIIVKGVVLVERKYPGDYQDGKLSCVVVWRSAQP